MLPLLRSVARTGETSAWSFRDFRLTNDSLGQPVDLVAGAKLTGRLGPWNLGFLGVQQDAAGDVDADMVLVGRAAVDVLETSSVGLIATYGDPRSNLESWLVGTDWNYRNTTWLTGQAVEAGAWRPLC